MATMVQKRQQFIRYCRGHIGKKEINMRDVAEMALKMGWRLPKPVHPLDLLARQFADAAREETRSAKETKRVYKANLSITKRLPDGKQLALWFDVDDNPPRNRMLKALSQYREQMVGEAVIGINTAEHWSRNHPDQIPLPFDADLTDDAKWRISGQDEEDKAS